MLYPAKLRGRCSTVYLKRPTSVTFCMPLPRALAADAAGEIGVSGLSPWTMPASICSASKRTPSMCVWACVFGHLCPRLLALRLQRLGLLSSATVSWVRAAKAISVNSTSWHGVSGSPAIA